MTAGPPRPEGGNGLAMLMAESGRPLTTGEVEGALPALDEMPFPVLWIGSGHELRWANRTALAARGGERKPLCFQQLHGYDRPCGEHSLLCPTEVAQACGRSASTTHVCPDPTGTGVSRLVAVPVTDGSSMELMVPLPQPLSEDRLTGLLPRQIGAPLVERTFDLLRRLGRPVAALMIDLDFFKRINDRHGHEAGDRVLAAVGGVLRACNRRTDIAIRWGGEEFLLVLPDTDLQDALLLAEKIRRAIAGMPLTLGTQGVSITASIGIWAGAAPADPDTAIREADRALMEAKRAGRDRCVVAQGPAGAAERG